MLNYQIDFKSICKYYYIILQFLSMLVGIFYLSSLLINITIKRRIGAK
jgi:hypothetical protein